MNAVSEDLWPPDIAADVPITPVNILKAQASRIGEKTRNIVEGRVDTNVVRDRLIHSFKLVAPALGNYSYELFRISHDVKVYPVTVEPWDQKVASEEEFVEWLRARLASPETHSVVGSLLAQSS